MRGIAPIDVAVVDTDLLWRVEHMNLIHNCNVKDYGTVDDAAEELTSGYPAVILVGPNAMVDELHLIADLHHAQPECMVIAVVEQPTPELVLRAEAVGVSRIVALDEGKEAIAAAVEEVRGEVQPEASHNDARDEYLEPEHLSVLPTNLVVVTSAKGGEGVTTVAANLAATLAHRNARVSLIEGDPSFGDLAMLLHLPTPPATSVGRPGPSGYGRPVIERLSVEPDVAHIRVIVPPRPPERIEQLDAEAFLGILAGLESLRDVTVVDAPLELVLAAELQSLAAAVLLVSTIRTTSMKNALIATRALGKTDNVHLVINEAGRHHNDPERREIERAVGLDVAALLPYEPKLDRAGASSSPSVIADQRSGFARGIASLADLLVERALLLNP